MVQHVNINRLSLRVNQLLLINYFHNSQRKMCDEEFHTVKTTVLTGFRFSTTLQIKLCLLVEQQD